jgi:hypothetical protein
MGDLVDKIIAAGAEERPITYSESELRKRVSTYIELLWWAGKRDPDAGCAPAPLKMELRRCDAVSHNRAPCGGRQAAAQAGPGDPAGH